MKGIVMTGPGRSELRDLPDVFPDENQVRIRLKYVGVCMSEHDAWAGAKAGDVFGHEPLGTIIQVGEHVKDYAVGDVVSGFWGGTLPGAGGMVEYAVADPRKDLLIKCPEGVRMEDFVLEPLSCMMSAVSKMKVSMPGTWACVVGCGYMGCGVISLLKLRGARVVAVDIRPESLANAKKYGADECYLAEEAVEKYIKNPGFPGFEMVTEWGETEESLDLAIRLTKKCGQLCVGAYHTGGDRSVDMKTLGGRAIECLNTHPREHDLSVAGAKNAAELLASEAWNYKELPVKIFPMSKFDEAHVEASSKYGRYMKALIDMERTDGEPVLLG